MTREKLILKDMDKKDINSLILFNSNDCRDYNVDYLINYNANGIVVLNKDEKFLFTSPLESGTLKGIVNVEIIDFKSLDDVKKFLVDNKIKFDKVGINKKNILLDNYNGLKEKLGSELIDFGQELERSRMNKDESEISLMKRAARIACGIIEEASNKANPKITELQLKDFIRRRMFENDVVESFETIVASGKNAANAHHISRNAKLKGFVVIDMGVRYRNYCSDITKTIYVGKPSEKEKQIYNKILDVQDNSINMLKNENMNDIYNYAKDKLGKPFIHSLGHGIGLEVHEMPTINKNANFMIKDNNVVTIEPGYYIKNKFGIRIEDMILFKNKPIIITDVDKNLIIK